MRFSELVYGEPKEVFAFLMTSELSKDQIAAVLANAMNRIAALEEAKFAQEEKE